MVPLFQINIKTFRQTSWLIVSLAKFLVNKVFNPTDICMNIAIQQLFGIAGIRHHVFFGNNTFILNIVVQIKLVSVDRLTAIYIKSNMMFRTHMYA